MLRCIPRLLAVPHAHTHTRTHTHAHTDGSVREACRQKYAKYLQRIDSSRSSTLGRIGRTSCLVEIRSRESLPRPQSMRSIPHLSPEHCLHWILHHQHQCIVVRAEVGGRVFGEASCADGRAEASTAPYNVSCVTDTAFLYFLQRRHLSVYKVCDHKCRYL